MLKIDILTFGSGYRVAMIITRYITAKGIIPDNLKKRIVLNIAVIEDYVSCV